MRRVKKKPPKRIFKENPYRGGNYQCGRYRLYDDNDLAYSRPFAACLPYTVSSRRSCHGYGILLFKSKGREPNKTDETKQSHHQTKHIFLKITEEVSP